MTVSITQTKVLYTGNGETTQWDIPFPFLDKEDLKVYLVEEDGSTLLLNTDYSVDTHLSKLTYPLQTNGVEPLTSNQRLLIMRDTPLVQETAFDAQDALDPDVLEKGYDKAMLIAQEFAEQLGRTLKISPTETSADKTADEYFRELEEDVLLAENAATAAAQAQQSAQAAADGVQSVLDNIDAALAAKQDALTAGTDITLNNNVISAAPSWGNISGTLAQQTDLQNALNAKSDTSLSNLTDTGKIVGASLAMPSDRYIELTLGATNASYTAPADGYFVLIKTSGISGAYINASRNNFLTYVISTSSRNSEALGFTVPVKKGDVLSVAYNATGTQYNSFKFVYAQGSVSEAN